MLSFVLIETLGNLSLRLSCGRCMNRRRGRTCRNSCRIHGGMTCVDGDRKWTLSPKTVTTMEQVTSTMVNRRYLPIRGVARDVGGLISATRRRKILSELRIVMAIVIFSPV